MKELKSRLKTESHLPLEKQTVINLFLTNSWIKNELLIVLKPHDLSLEQLNG